MKIIIATGHADLNESLFSFLQNDCEILGVPETREDCLALIHNQPDLAIVSQYLLGNIDLVEMLYAIRLEETRIIFLAPAFNPADPTFKKIIDLGIYDFVSGNVTMGDILEKINRPTTFKEAISLLNVAAQPDLLKPFLFPGQPPGMSGQHKPKAGNIITVLSPCPSGKTMFAVNLAAMLADNGNSVALVDLDLQNLAINNWLKCPPGTKALFDVLQSIKEKEDIVDILNFSYRPREVSGLWVFGSDLAEARSFKEKAVSDFLNHLSEEVNYIVIDTDGDLENPVTQTTLEKSFRKFFITSQDYNHLNMSYNYLVNGELKDYSVILNRYVESPVLTAVDAEQTLTRPVDFIIPDSTPVIYESIKGGVPAIMLDPDLKQIFREISTTIA